MEISARRAAERLRHWIATAALCTIRAAVRSIPSAAGVAMMRRFDMLVMTHFFPAQCGEIIEAAP